MGQVSYGTITITDTNDIERIYTVYAKSTTNTTAPSAAASSWTESISTAPGSGDYIWQRTVVEKSGTGELTYGNPVCVTGPEGDPGATGKGVKSLVTQYYLSTSSSSVAGGSWNTTPQSYPTTGTKYYWTKTITTYTDNTTYESTAVYDVALTSSVKDARDANITADEAKDIAQQTSDDLDNLTTTYNTFINTRAKYFVHNSTGSIVIGSREGESTPVAFDENTISTYGYNALMGPAQISLRYNDKILSSWSSSALTFYSPSTTTQGKKAIQLSNNGLSFYNPSNDSISMMDLTSSGLIFKTSAGTEIGKFGSDSSGGLLELSGRLDIKGGGRIGQDSDNYWEFGDNKSYNDEDSAYLIGKGTASIQSGETGHWRIDSNRIHTGWYQLSDSSSSTPAGSLHFDTGTDNGSTYYWDYGMHYPNKAGGGNNKFIYIRRSNATTSTTLGTMKGRIDDDAYWTYKFYIDGDGNVHAKNFYVGDSNTPVGGGTGSIAEFIINSDSSYGKGSLTQPIYIDSNGRVATTTYQLNAAGAKGVITDLVNNTTSTNLPTAAAVANYVTSRGYITSFTDKNVQTTKANTTKIYLAGTQTNETNTGTLNFDEYVYVDTTAGALHATTFNGYTLAAAAAKGVDTSMTATSTSTNLPTTKAVADLIATYLPLAGGTVSGAVDINDELYADSATFGNLIVNGVGRFTNGLYGDLTGNVTGSITGNAVTADKVNHNLVIKLASGTTEGTNMFTFNGSAAKTVDITKSALGLENVENKSSATIRGELTSANVTTALGFAPYNSTNPNGYTSNVGTITGVTAGTGLSGGGTSGTVTLNHSNSVTAQTTQGIYPIKIDAQGHISAYGSAPTTLSGYGIIDAKIANGVITLGSNTITPLTSQWTANLYVGKTATDKANAAATNGNVYLNLVENSTVRNAHKITGSGTTTVTSDADGNITISSADSKTGTVTSITLTQGTGISIGSSGTAITTSGSRTIGLADNYGDTKNPYANKTARYVLAAPADAAGVPTFRALTSADVGLGNVLNAAQVTGIGQGADGKIRVYKGDSNYEDVAVEIVATESSSVASAQKLTSYGGSTKQPVYFPSTGANAGKPVAINYTIETSVPNGAVFTDTTYTFAGGTNGFTVTPLNGTAQTVTVTPSITNNITGSGTSGYLAKFNGANSITNGPALGTDTTKFLNNKGEWATPSGAVTGVKGNSESTYRTGQVNITKANIGLGNVDNTADANKNVLTATKFSSSRTIALTGDVTGSASGDGSSGWSISTIVGDDSHNHSPETLYIPSNYARTGSIDLISATRIGSYMSNKSFAIPPEAITIEYSTDSGSTWQDYEATDLHKRGLFAETRNNCNTYLGKASTKEANSLNNQLRITISRINLGRYTAINSFYTWMTTNGNTVYCKLERSLNSSPTVFETVFDNFRLAGWSGHNIRYFPTIALGGGNGDQPYALRLTVWQTAITTNYPSANLYDIRFYGPDTYSASAPYYKVQTNELYTWDNNLNAIFPAQVTATQFNGNATSATKANLTTTANAIAYYTDAAGTFGSKASANGALYATSANGALTFGILPAAQGGTGKTNLKDAANALINTLDTGSSNLTSNDYVITQYVGGGTTTTTYHRRPASALRVGGLLTGRKLKVALGSTTDVTFDGTTDVTNIPVSGTLGVSNGGTGTTSFTSGALLIGNGSNAIGTRSIVNNTSKGALGWTGSATTASNLYIPTLNTLAYWNGAYSGTDSNLTYCIKGAFGTATIKDSTTSVASGGTALPTAGAVYTAIRAASDTYVTLTTAQTLTAAATKIYLGLQLYGSQGIGFGTTGTNDAVTQKANVKYDASLEAIVFSFS